MADARQKVIEMKNAGLRQTEIARALRISRQRVFQILASEAKKAERA